MVAKMLAIPFPDSMRSLFSRTASPLQTLGAD